MSDLIDQEALALLADISRPRRRVRPRVARTLADAEAHEIETPSGPVAAWRLGEGPAVLLVHGWEDDNSLWTSAVDAFLAWGRPVVALDLPGHGFSEAEDASLQSAGAAIAAVAKTLGPIEAMIGHSFGCPAIVHALAQGASAERVVLIATPMPRTQPRRPLELEIPVAPEVLARAEELRAERANDADAFIVANLPTLTQPCLVIHSLDDEACAFENSQALVDLWPGAQLLAVDQLGHRLVAQDAGVLEQVVAFVEGAP